MKISDYQREANKIGAKDWHDLSALEFVKKIKEVREHMRFVPDEEPPLGRDLLARYTDEIFTGGTIPLEEIGTAEPVLTVNGKTYEQWVINETTPAPYPVWKRNDGVIETANPTNDPYAQYIGINPRPTGRIQPMATHAEQAVEYNMGYAEMTFRENYIRDIFHADGTVTRQYDDYINTDDRRLNG